MRNNETLFYGIFTIFTLSYGDVVGITHGIM